MSKRTGFKRERLNAWIRYYGYESAVARTRKHAFYSQYDPNFQSVSEMWKLRERMRAYPYPKNIDCREIGITKTVTY